MNLTVYLTIHFGAAAERSPLEPAREVDMRGLQKEESDMLDEERGAQAIVELQAKGGVTETLEQAKIGWGRMSDNEKRSTETAHVTVCGGFVDKQEGLEDA